MKDKTPKRQPSAKSKNTSQASSSVDDVSQNIIVEPILDIETLHSCLPVFLDAYNSNPWFCNWTESKGTERLEFAYSSPSFLGYRAVLNTEVVGAILGNIEPFFSGDFLMLRDVVVSTSARRLKAGSMLFSELHKGMMSRGIESILLITNKENFPFEYYKHLGFKTIKGMRVMHLDMF